MAAHIAPARQVAFEILCKVMRGQGNSDTLLFSSLVNRLSSQDRNLCTTLVLGTLRWQNVLDTECRRFLVRPGLNLQEDALLALRLGAYQLLFLDRIPPHAAIFESVEWAKHSEGARQAGLVNAVLRKVSGLPKKRDFNAAAAYPQSMIERWRKFYGEVACQHICAQGQTETSTALRLLTPDAEEKLSLEGAALLPGKLLTKARLLAGYDDLENKGAGTAQKNEAASRENMAVNRNALREMQAYAQFQDEGSQLVAELLGTGKRILDRCAAPGGKTAVLLQNNPEAQLLACDVHPARLAAMQRRMAATTMSDRIEYRVADAAALARVGLFDRILCDVPCTGTGTLARNPEIRHRLQPADLSRQAERQRAILSNAMRLLTSGGRLLYSTCSLEPEENEAIVQACLTSPENCEHEWSRIDLRTEFDRLEGEGIVGGEAVSDLRATGFRGGYLRTLPGVHPCDGFFAALIERR